MDGLDLPPVIDSVCLKKAWTRYQPEDGRLTGKVIPGKSLVV